MMKFRWTQIRERITQSRAYFAVFKLPVILFTALFGFILEFIIELPFMVLCMLDRRAQKAEDENGEPGNN